MGMLGGSPGSGPRICRQPGAHKGRALSWEEGGREAVLGELAETMAPRRSHRVLLGTKRSIC